MASDDHPFPQAEPETRLWTLFTCSGPGWTGGDSTYSIPLPDGRTVWIFSDTFLGPVTAARTRPSSAPLIHNSLVVQDSDHLTTLHGGTASAPRPRFTPNRDGSWYWSYDGTVEGDRLRLFLLRYVRYGPEQFDWRWTGTDLATLRLPDLTTESIAPLPVRNGVQYGAAILETEEFTYIYGVEDLHAERYAHLARARPGEISGAWEFFTGRRWSKRAEDSARLHTPSIGNEFTAFAHGDGYRLVTMDTTDDLLSWREIVLYRAASPTGPWAGRTVLYTAPEADHPRHFVYNAQAHPQLSGANDLLISYNVNSTRFEDLYEDADLYRARFIRVHDFDRLPEGPG